MIICIHYSQVVLKGQIYSALVINNQFSAKYISIFHPQVFSERTNLLWRKAVTSQRHSRSAWQQPVKSTLSQELHSNVQCHPWLLEEICVTLQCKLQQKLCVALQCMKVQCHWGFAWHCNTQCHRSCAWHCNTLMYNVLHGSAIYTSDIYFHGVNVSSSCLQIQKHNWNHKNEIQTIVHDTIVTIIQV